MKRPYFQRYGLLILMFVCFWVPFGLRGARMGAREMRNDVKDWLPDRFEETRQLEEFRRHFLGEAFVVLSWDGCHGAADDERFRMFVDQFFPELPPSQRAAETADASPSEVQVAAAHVATDQYVNHELGLYTRQLRGHETRTEFLGNRYGFYFTGNFHTNWGGLQEKWFRGDDGRWYYILPKGDIYRWDESSTLVTGFFRGLQRAIWGTPRLRSTLIARTGDWDGPWYYKDPRRLEADLFKSMITGPALLSDLTQPGGALEGNVPEAMRRLSGVLFGPDGKQTCILVSLNDLGRQNLHRVLGRGTMGRFRGRLLWMAERAGLRTPPPPSRLPTFLQPLFERALPETSAPELRMGGPPVDNVAIDEEGQITLVRLVGLSVVVGIFVSWLNFRNWSIVLILFFVGAIAAIFSLSIVWWGGSTLDAVLMSMPSLVYVLGLSGAVHLANYYRDTVDAHGYPGRPEEALAHGWKPCTIAALTTALGLISLCTSDIVPIRKFGFFSAVGVLFTLTLLFSFLPAALSLWPPRDFGTRRGPQRSVTEMVTAFWARVGLFVVRRSGVVSLVCVLVAIVAAWGIPRIRTSVQLLKLFDADSKIIHDYSWLETNLGKLVPMEVLVRVSPTLMRSGEIEALDTDSTDNGSIEEKFRLNFLERMEIVDNIRREIDAQFGTGGGEITGRGMSATTFVPPLPGSGGNVRQAAARGAYSRTLANYRDQISQSEYFCIDEDQSELWRLSLRLGALNDVDYGQFVEKLKTAVEPILTAYDYRDRILRQIDERNGGQGFRGGRVLLLGAPLGKSPFAPKVDPVVADYASTLDASAPLPSSDAAADPKVEIDQTAVFLRNLVFLLKNAALNCRDWHDPRAALPDDFLEKVKEYDCVLLLRDDPRYPLDELGQRVPLIDARQVAYRPGDGSLTAAQKEWPISVTYTGLVPIVYKAQRTLLQNLISSTWWAFASISVVMMVLLRSPSAGIISMLPNVFPVVVIFGFMGWSDVLVDIGTMMTASVAMGVAVDDTIHFLTWFRRGLDRGLNRKSAIMLAYDRCATAMTQTTLIAGLGLAVFGFSTFTPTQRFGILMLALMVAALVGDLIFLPAMLAGPLGRVFSRKRDSATGKDEEAIDFHGGTWDGQDGAVSAAPVPGHQGESPPAATVSSMPPPPHRAFLRSQRGTGTASSPRRRRSSG